MVAGATHQINEEEEYYIGRAVAANILSQYQLMEKQAADQLPESDRQGAGAQVRAP